MMAISAPQKGSRLPVERIAAQLREAKCIDEIRSVRDQASAIGLYWRKRKASIEVQNDAAEVVLRAERRMGEILRETIPHKGGNPQLSSGTTVRLADLGITRDHSSRFQKLAAADEATFDQHVAGVRDQGERLTTRRAINAISHAAGHDGDEWHTPAEYIEAARQVMGGIDLDPASSEIAQRTVKAAEWYGKNEDGLTQPWHHRVWLNPPFSHPLGTQFANKLADELESGRVESAVFLQNNSTDTAWFRRLAPLCCLCFPKRIAFLRPDGTRHRGNQYAQILFYSGPDPGRFADVFSEFGPVHAPASRRVS